jgi:AraC family transcriptional regulator of adaptative response / DNA-3-methyladenine glycosylase II
LAALLQEISLQEREAAAGQPRDPVTLGLAEFARRMRDDPADEHRIAAWARRLGLGRDQLRRRFTAAHGSPPRAYLTLQRMRLAEQLLIDSSMAVAEIAVLAGYASQHFFSRHFRNHAGCSPSGFRRRRYGDSSPKTSSK